MLLCSFLHERERERETKRKRKRERERKKEREIKRKRKRERERKKEREIKRKKEKLIASIQLAHARAERDAMVEHDDPGVVTLYYSFQVTSSFLLFLPTNVTHKKLKFTLSLVLMIFVCLFVCVQ
jgi:uncharacterized membrane protein YdbT with pleckstrin-like domain